MGKYPNAPITEALFDIRVDPVLGVEVAEIARLHSLISVDYPEARPRRLWQTRLEFKDDRQVRASAEDGGIDGYLFWNGDKTQVAQFRLDGFTFSRLKPYDAWETHFPEAMRLWTIYRDRLGPLNIKRVATRFINSIEIAEPSVELGDYFVNPPQPPDDLPQELGGFLSRLFIRFEKGIVASTTFTSQQPAKPGTSQFIFDIEVFTDVGSPSGDAGLADRFDSLKEIKNRIFESYLTDKAKGLFA